MITLAGDDIIAQLHQRIGSREVKLSVRHLPGKVFLPLVMALLLHSLLTSTAWAERQHKVLVLYDENTDFPGLALFNQSLKAAFKAGAPDRIDLYTESMDLARFQDDRYMDLLRAFYRQKYANQRIDLVIAVMGPALDFLLRYGAELFPETPLVFCGISRQDMEGRDLGPNVTGVLVQRQFKGTLDLALRLQPATRQVVVISGTASFNKYWEAIARQEFHEYEGRLAFTYLTNHSMQEILQAVAHLPKHTIILYLHLFKDSTGNMFIPHEALSRISQAANAPVYGFVDQFLGQGIVGGHLFSLDLHGTEAAAAGLRILAGEKPAEMPLVTGRANTNMFDWRQLQRWGISEDRLPLGSLVRYKVPSMWQQYQGYIIGCSLLCGVEALLIIGLLLQRKKRRRVEQALEASYAQVQSLFGRLLAAQEAERTRIARELHDDITQQLAALSIALSGLKRRLPADTADALTRLQQRTIALADALRHLSHDLHPGVLQHAGLIAALKTHCAEFESQHAIAVTLTAAAGLETIPQAIALCLYRVAQEALRNIAVHAGAHRAYVTLSRTADGLELTITDDGQGFDLPTARSRGGLGLISLDERVRLVGGSVQINTQLQRGTELRVQVPLDGHKDAPHG